MAMKKIPDEEMTEAICPKCRKNTELMYSGQAMAKLEFIVHNVKPLYILLLISNLQRF